MSRYCIFEQARRDLGMDDAEWSRFLRERGGVSCSDDLYVDTPEIAAAGAHVLNSLRAMGYSSPRVMEIGADWLIMVHRCARERGLSDPELHALAVGYGHARDWPVAMMNGRTFQRLVAHFRGLGCALPELARTWITPETRDVLVRLRRAFAIGDARYAALLCDFGGGAFDPSQLDEAGFASLVLAMSEPDTAGRDASEPDHFVGRTAPPRLTVGHA